MKQKMEKKVFLMAVIGFCGVLALCTPGWAVEVTVCASGCDYTDIQAAVDSVSEEDTITVKAGSYPEFVTNKGYLAIVAEDGVAITPLTDYRYGIVMHHTGNVTVQGFQIDNAFEIGVCTYATGYIKIANNQFSNNSIAAIDIRVSGAITITNNKFTSGSTALKLTSGDDINAKYNYWGDASGPSCGTGCTGCPGTGAQISGCNVGTIDYSPWCTTADCDFDGDGFKVGEDCDDEDPNNWTSCGTCVDVDTDTWYIGCDAYITINGPDCDDTDPDVNPGADEACDDKDNNCDEDIDEGCSDPVLVELSSFTASPSDREVIIKWSTESEIDNAGFNLYRSESEDGEYELINDDIIPAEGSPTEGASYSFVDAGVKNRKTYYYILEDVDLNGISTSHGPVSATPRLVYEIRK